MEELGRAVRRLVAPENLMIPGRGRNELTTLLTQQLSCLHTRILLSATLSIVCVQLHLYLPINPCLVEICKHSSSIQFTAERTKNDLSGSTFRSTTMLSALSQPIAQRPELTTPKQTPRNVTLKAGSSTDHNGVLQVPEGLVWEVPYFRELVIAGEMNFLKPFRIEKHAQPDIEAALRYFQTGNVPVLTLPVNNMTTDHLHVEVVKYTRAYVVADKLGLHDTRDDLAGKIGSYGLQVPTISPRLLEILSVSDLHSTWLYSCLMQATTSGLEKGLYRRSMTFELEDGYACVFSRWPKQDLLNLLARVGPKKFSDEGELMDHKEGIPAAFHER